MSNERFLGTDYFAVGRMMSEGGPAVWLSADNTPIKKVGKKVDGDEPSYRGYGIEMVGHPLLTDLVEAIKSYRFDPASSAHEMIEELVTRVEGGGKVPPDESLTGMLFEAHIVKALRHARDSGFPIRPIPDGLHGGGFILRTGSDIGRVTAYYILDESGEKVRHGDTHSEHDAAFLLQVGEDQEMLVVVEAKAEKDVGHANGINDAIRPAKVERKYEPFGAILGNLPFAYYVLGLKGLTDFPGDWKDHFRANGGTLGSTSVRQEQLLLESQHIGNKLLAIRPPESLASNFSK